MQLISPIIVQGRHSSWMARAFHLVVSQSPELAVICVKPEERARQAQRKCVCLLKASAREAANFTSVHIPFAGASHMATPMQGRLGNGIPGLASLPTYHSITTDGKNGVWGTTALCHVENTTIVENTFNSVYSDWGKDQERLNFHLNYVVGVTGTCLVHQPLITCN